jgi:hypothetical protein
VELERVASCDASEFVERARFELGRNVLECMNGIDEIERVVGVRKVLCSGQDNVLMLTVLDRPLRDIYTMRFAPKFVQVLDNDTRGTPDLENIPWAENIRDSFRQLSVRRTLSRRSPVVAVRSAAKVASLKVILVEISIADWARYGTDL